LKTNYIKYFIDCKIIDIAILTPLIILMFLFGLFPNIILDATYSSILLIFQNF
jgi:NADH:ubiquinone oxidoreductase subunit 4 (subunit M)